MRLRKVVFGGGVLLLVALVGLFIRSRFLEWIPAGHVGVLFHAQGGLERKVYTPRRVWVPFMTTLYVYPTKQQVAIYTNDPDEGEVKTADAVRVTTNDNATTDFDVVVWYHIETDDVLTVFDNYRTQPIAQIQSTAIRAAVRQAVSDVGTQYDAFALMGRARGEASAKLATELRGILGPKGITIDRADFAGSYPNENIARRIMGQVNAETDLRIAELNRQIAEERKAIAITQAEARSTAARLTALQTRGKSLEILSLEADIEGLKKWDGNMPLVRTRKGQTVIVSGDALSSLQQSQPRSYPGRGSRNEDQ